MPVSGNSTTIQQIRELVERNERLPARARDLLILNAIADIYMRIDSTDAHIESINIQMEPALKFYKVSLWILTIIIGTFIALAISGRVEMIITR